MSVRKFIATASLVLIASVAAPTKASADWLFTPFVGWNWGGTANLLDLPDFEDEFEQKAMFGASLGWMGAGIVGFEVDFGYSPNFFQNTERFRQLRIRRQQPDHADGQPRDWRADRRTERTRVPSLRGRWRGNHQEQHRFRDDFFDDSIRRTSASMSAPARSSSSRTRSACGATSATSGRSRTSNRSMTSISGSPTSTSGGARSG